MDKKNICGAKTKRGSICTQPAGKGTDHWGEGRCSLHERDEIKSPKSGRFRTNRFLETLVDPTLRERASILLDDPELLDCRAELAILKARMEQMGLEKDTSVADLTRLSNAIARLALAVQEMERGKQHFLHVTVTGAIVSAFADLGRAYILEPSRRYQFEQEMERIIRQAIKQRNARMVATSMLTPKISDLAADGVTPHEGGSDESGSDEGGGNGQGA